MPGHRIPARRTGGRVRTDGIRGRHPVGADGPDPRGPIPRMPCRGRRSRVPAGRVGSVSNLNLQAGQPGRRRAAGNRDRMGAPLSRPPHSGTMTDRRPSTPTPAGPASGGPPDCEGTRRARPRRRVPRAGNNRSGAATARRGRRPPAHRPALEPAGGAAPTCPLERPPRPIGGPKTPVTPADPARSAPTGGGVRHNASRAGVRRREPEVRRRIGTGELRRAVAPADAPRRVPCRAGVAAGG